MQALSEKWGMNKIFQDARLADAESYFCVIVYNACLDAVISQLTQRLIGLGLPLQPKSALQQTMNFLSKQASYAIFTKTT